MRRYFAGLISDIEPRRLKSARWPKLADFHLCTGMIVLGP
jgi:hypothetical protein